MALSPADARRFYDRAGRALDSQAFYEDAAIDRMVARAEPGRAHAVFELGCGTGRLARRLLAGELPADASYTAADVSPEMTRITAERLRGWAERVETVVLEPGAGPLPGATGGFDRFIATYVFDLLGEADTKRLLAEARRLLSPDGRLCLVSITGGAGGLPRLVSAGWSAIGARFPQLVGGCRPIDLRAILDRDTWTVTSDEVVTKWAVSSQVLIAGPAGR